jgi:N6-adenosine-specific RNA methylase IME4
LSKYQIIYADPAWSYADQGCQGTMANHYSGMPIEEIKRLPVAEIADDNSILFLWATFPMLKEALEVIDAWGFEYKSIGFLWVKLNPNNMGAFFGLGRWTRGNTEPCLLATRGKPHRLNNDVFQLIMSPRQQHSRKPTEIRERIVSLMGDLPRIELFARNKVVGWDAWGNEVESDIKLCP